MAHILIRLLYSYDVKRNVVEVSYLIGECIIYPNDTC